jgi:ABC-type uncharacterized transport system permease subunit
MPQNNPRKKLAFKKLHKTKKSKSIIQKIGIKNILISSGILLGAIIGFALQLNFWCKYYKISSVLKYFGKEVFIGTLWGCLAGGILGFLIGFALERYKLKKA